MYNASRALGPRPRSAREGLAHAGRDPITITREKSMLASESILAWIVIGAIAGWLAGRLVKGYGFGLIGNIVIGILGAGVAGLPSCDSTDRKSTRLNSSHLGIS